MEHVLGELLILDVWSLLNLTNLDDYDGAKRPAIPVAVGERAFSQHSQKSRAIHPGRLFSRNLFLNDDRSTLHYAGYLELAMSLTVQELLSVPIDLAVLLS
jgi:hypothetical protein